MSDFLKKPELVISLVSLLISTVTALFIASYQTSHSEFLEQRKAIATIKEALHDIHICMKRENLEAEAGAASPETKCSSDEVRRLIFRHDTSPDLSDDKTVVDMYHRYADDLLSFAAISVATAVLDESWPQSLVEADNRLERLNDQHSVFVGALRLCGFSDLHQDTIRLEDALFLFPEQTPFDDPQTAHKTSDYSGAKAYHPMFRHEGAYYVAPAGTPVRSTIAGIIS